ncbi:MTH1187 family thiamine-binding protein [Paenibacillus sp.]|uniref:thiamine-binding protein n=1 Tax=Paenibacillus sp. TaxID=58172 RepID=UPI002D694A78|nr:MTH1187 family thiamine-binding protein [Paenibacillus sp.]HZG84960.1 MTH1187 family thiamine-binding protein [Paenibacillus sp.]
MADALVSIQILPRTPNGESVIPYVDRAIEIIQASGVRYVVGPLETTMEGDFSELLEIVKAMNDEMIRLGAPSVLSQVKISYNPTDGASIDRLIAKYRT